MTPSGAFFYLSVRLGLVFFNTVDRVHTRKKGIIAPRKIERTTASGVGLRQKTAAGTATATSTLSVGRRDGKNATQGRQQERHRPRTSDGWRRRFGRPWSPGLRARDRCRGYAAHCRTTRFDAGAVSVLSWGDHVDVFKKPYNLLDKLEKMFHLIF